MSMFFPKSSDKKQNLNELSTEGRHKKRRNATKTRFSTIQPSIDMTGIRNERWQ